MGLFKKRIIKPSPNMTMNAPTNQVIDSELTPNEQPISIVEQQNSIQHDALQQTPQNVQAPQTQPIEVLDQTPQNIQPQNELQQQQNQQSAPLPGIGQQPLPQNSDKIETLDDSPLNAELPEEASAITEKKAKVQRPVKRYRYKVINNMGKKEQGTFDAETENDVRNFLQSQEYQVLEVKERSAGDIDIGGNGKLKAADLSFSLTQLSTYLKSGIPLADAVRILAKQTKKANLKKSFSQLVYELLKGESLSDAMELQDKTYPKLLINMVKTAEMTGDLPSILDDMAEYYTSMDQTKKQMKSAMTYPIVVLTIAIGVLVFMLTYLVPQFTSLFAEQGAELPALTKLIIGVSDFIKTKWYIIIITIVSIILIFYLLFSKVQKFRETIQILLMHTPVVNNIIIYNEIANFTKTFASLLNHGVFITDSMEILSKITTNEVYKKIINQTLENLSKGDSISMAFRGQWSIPVVAYEMIVTGETTGQLGSMMEKVATHFQMLHKNVIDQMKSLVEPILICFLAIVVGIILVSIIQPMFSIYSQIK